MTHTGVRIKITSPAGVLLEGDSDWLHMAAMLAGYSWDENDQAALDESRDYPWHQFLQASNGLEIWIQACQLADEHPDDEDQAADDDPGGVEARMVAMIVWGALVAEMRRGQLRDVSAGDGHMAVTTPGGRRMTIVIS